MSGSNLTTKLNTLSRKKVIDYLTIKDISGISSLTKGEIKLKKGNKENCGDYFSYSKNCRHQKIVTKYDDIFVCCRDLLIFRYPDDGDILSMDSYYLNFRKCFYYIGNIDKTKTSFRKTILNNRVDNFVLQDTRDPDDDLYLNYIYQHYNYINDIINELNVSLIWLEISSIKDIFNLLVQSNMLSDAFFLLVCPVFDIRMPRLKNESNADFWPIELWALFFTLEIYYSKSPEDWKNVQILLNLDNNQFYDLCQNYELLYRELSTKLVMDDFINLFEN